MYDVIMGFGTNVHILWGIGLLGLLIKMWVNFHVKSLVKASENMATTRKRSLRIMRQKYVNGRNLGINRGNGAAFVEKNIRRLKWAGLPLELWKRSGMVLSVLSVMLMSGSFIYYETRWRGSPDMVTFLANGVLVCAFLVIVENIFLVNNKLEILKANIRDYLENLTLPPPKSTVAPEDLREFGDLRGQLRDAKTVKEETVSKEIAASKEHIKDAGDGREVLGVSEKVTSIDNERVLDSFLKEFFS